MVQKHFRVPNAPFSNGVSPSFKTEQLLKHSIFPATIASISGNSTVRAEQRCCRSCAGGAGSRQSFVQGDAEQTGGYLQSTAAHAQKVADGLGNTLPSTRIVCDSFDGVHQHAVDGRAAAVGGYSEKAKGLARKANETPEVVQREI